MSKNIIVILTISLILSVVMVFLIVGDIDNGNDSSISVSDVSVSSSGRTYYVDSVSGSDSNLGTSESSPFKTLGKVSGLDLNPGDSVLLKRGSTWNGTMKIYSNDEGSQSQRLTIGAYGTGDKPIIENTSSPTNNRYIGLDIFQTGGFLTVENIHFRDIAFSGIQVLENRNEVLIKDCEFEDVGMGVNVKGSNVTVDSNYFHDLKMVVNTEGGKDDYGAFAVNVLGGSAGISNITISNNRVERAIAPSFDYGHDGGAVELFEEIDGVYIFNNFVKDSKGFIESGGSGGDDTLQNVYVYNNISKDNVGGPFIFFNAPSGNDPYDAAYFNYVVENNTIYHTANSSSSSLDTKSPIWFAGKMPNQNTLKFRNNIVYLNGVSDVADFDDYLHENNLFYREDGSINTNSGSKAHLPNSSEIVNQSPLFVDPANDDFRLQEGSPAIDAGTSVDFESDYVGNLRNQGGATDMGAIEFLEDDPVIGVGGTDGDDGGLTNQTCEGDYNVDGIINIVDFSTFAVNYNKDDIQCNLDIIGEDCRLTLNDFAVFTSNYNDIEACAIN